MRRLTYLLLSVVLAVSCVHDWTQDNGSCIELTLRCNDPVLSKAGNNGTQDGVDRYNENLIDTVDFFFYPGKDPDRTADAKYHTRIISGARNSDVFRIENLSSEDINSKIFPTIPIEIRKATVFAVVNFPGNLDINEETLEGTSLDSLERIICRADFVSPENHRQNKFVMSGSTTIDLRSRSQIMTAVGAIDLERYASKITVGVKVADRVVLGDSEIWTPLLEGLEIYLVHGASTVALCGRDTTPDYFSYSGNKMKFVTKDADNNLVPIVGTDGEYYNTYPMYTYPVRWTYGSSDGYDREPFLKLTLPWARLEENGFNSTQRQLYYKIMIPVDSRGEGYECNFVRNNWYHLNIDVGILGAEADEAAVTVDPGSCFMVDWQEKDFVLKMAEIGNARYLSVARDSIVLNNISETSIGYTTSHPVVILDNTISVTRPYYGQDPDKHLGQEKMGGVIREATTDAIYKKGSYYLEYDKSHREAMNGGVDWFYNSGTGIVMSHELNNDYTSLMFDYSPYTISFTLAHEDRPTDERYHKKIKIIQYPAIYIEALRNSDSTFVFIKKMSGNKNIHSSDYWGYVYIDNEQLYRPYIHEDNIDKLTQDYIDTWKSWDPPLDHGDDPEEYHWRVVWYTGGSRDMFKINVTVLPPRTEFVIGDPRSQEIDNLRNSDNDPNNNFKDGPALDAAEPVRSLKYYYPAEVSDRTVNMLAPQYRFSSKCNGTEFGQLTRAQATMRCATYQEDGFPAGRWRLPTRGEIRFVAMLSAHGLFEMLFSDGGYYWSANGCVRVSNAAGVTDENRNTALLRCVYDSWYWGDEQQENREQFVWGDKAR